MEEKKKKVYVIDQKRCVACGSCDIECPRHAILISHQGKFSIDPEKCVGCGICAANCPVDAAAVSEN